jgi:probable F420-dependent oxidoreductase
VRLGFSSMNNLEELSPQQLGRELEDRGFDSLWYGEHSHIPVSRATPYPTGGEMPDEYRRMMDPFLSLLLAAAATERLLLGTGVALPLEHDVLDLAKTVSTIDHHTSGRFLFGVGVGWNQEELANHKKIPWARRYRALHECVEALRTLWTAEESEYHGEFYDFERLWMLPKPLQQPHPPVLCGTGGKLGTREAVAWADAWMPMDIALGDVARKVSKFREVASAAGRDPEAIPITIVAMGDVDMATLSLYRDLGVERTVVGAGRTGWDDPTTTLPCLDHFAGLMGELA